MVSHLEMVLRIGVGATLGGIIGYERDLHGRPVGLRTHLLVALASATFMVVSTQFVYFQHYGKDDLVEVDASRIAASVVSGIGFLAGGAILRTGVTVQGLTTSAGLWLVTAIGLCAGGGMYFESVVVMVIGVLALTTLRRFEDKDDRLVRRRLSVVLVDKGGVTKVVEALAHIGARVNELEYDRRLDDKSRVSATFDVQLPSEVAMAKLIEQVELVSGVMRVHVTPLG